MGATLQIKLNGGAPATGAIVASVGDVVQPTAADKTGWGNPPTKWILYDYPLGFSLPSGWTTDTDGSYYALGSGDPPTFTLSTWGKYMLQLVVLGGANSTGGGATDESTAIEVLSPNGLHDHGRREDAQFGGTRKRSMDAYQKNVRTIETGIAIAKAAILPPATSYTSGTPTLAPTANAPESIFYLSGSVSTCRLPPASGWIGQRIVVKCENLSGASLVADTGAPDLIDGASTYAIPGLWQSVVLVAKAAAVIRAFPGLT